MICKFCGHEVDDKVAECPYCNYIFDKDAQVLSREERDTFDGVTIDEEGNAEDSREQRAPGYSYEDGYRHEREEQQYQQNPNIKVYPLGCGSSMLMTLLILGGILALFFFLLPTFLVFAAIGAVVVFFLRLFM